jgi:uncharacterized protein YkwD
MIASRNASASLLLGLSLTLFPTVGKAQDQKDGPKLKLSDAEKTLLDLTNKARADKKLAPLEPNATLFQVARAHSANMAKNNEMAHELDGKNPAQRVRAAGYNFRHVGENVGWSDGAPVAEVFKGWMDSEEHRKNLLNPDFREIGLGIARSEKGEFYYTQLLGTRKK